MKFLKYIVVKFDGELEMRLMRLTEPINIDNSYNYRFVRVKKEKYPHELIVKVDCIQYGE